MGKVLVTGGAGYIGSHTIRHLQAIGANMEDVVVFDNLIYGHAHLLPQGVTLIIGDLLDRSAIRRVFKDYDIEAVIHFAAYASVGESVTNPSKYFINNVYGGINLLDAMIKAGCDKLVFSSTCATYGTHDQPVSEELPQRPINPYGLSKLYFEGILKEYQKAHGINSITFRYFNAAGAGYGIGEISLLGSRLIPNVIDALLSDAEIKVFGNDYPTADGTCIRDYISVIDLAEAHHLALARLRGGFKGTDHFNLGTGEGTSVLKIIKLAEQASGKTAKITFLSRREGDPPSLVADASKARRLLGWQSKQDIAAVINAAYLWHKSRHDKA